jgi:hypothetical protein
MAEPVPLTGGLGIESPDIVIHCSRRLLVDVFVEELAAKKWRFLGVKGPIE